MDVAGIDAKSDAIYELVEEGSGVEKLATGFTFTEGPIWHPTEQHLLFSDMPGDVRRKYTPDGTVVETMRPSFIMKKSVGLQQPMKRPMPGPPSPHWRIITPCLS